jgi:hypothetical protein
MKEILLTDTSGKEKVIKLQKPKKKKNDSYNFRGKKLFSPILLKIISN